MDRRLLVLVLMMELQLVDCARRDPGPAATITVAKPAVAVPAAVPVEASAPCPDEANTAVLGKLSPMFSLVQESVTVAWLDRRDYNLQCVRDWATGLKDTCM